MSETEKNCATCGRRIEWRKKWKDCWDEVRYCSERCRRGKKRDAGLEESILQLLKERSANSTICPSEAARRHFGEAMWRENMEKARSAARRLVAAGQIEIVQKGQVIDPSTAKGPIRLRKKK